MSQILPGRGRSTLPLGLLGMLALAAAIERYEVRAEPGFLSVHGASWRVAGREGIRAARRCAVLCFGDSLVKLGVLPRVLEARSGRPAYNLAVLNGPAPASFFLLRRALAAGARPEAIVVDFAEGILADGPSSPTRPYPWADLLDLGEALELAWTARDPDLLARTLVGRLLPSVRGRREVRARVRGALRGEPDAQRLAVQAYLRNWSRNGGGQAQPRESFAEPAPPPPGLRRASTWRPHPVHALYLHRFLALAGRHRIRVYWLLPPYPPVIQAHVEARGDDRPYAALARALLARFPELTVVDARHAGYERTAFWDSLHLDHDGAAALSAALAHLLRHQPVDPAPAGRWVSLPHFRPVAAPVEDLAQSTLAVQALESMRR